MGYLQESQVHTTSGLEKTRRTPKRKLEQEVKLNLAYRWFLGLDLEDAVPDHSTISQNLRRRFKKSGVFQEIFDTIIACCEAEGLIAVVIVTDSSHMKANASSDKLKKIQVEKKPSDYLEELEAEAKRLEDELQAQREAQGKKKHGKKVKLKGAKMIQKIVCSATDLDAGLLNRPGKPSGFHYLAHISVDIKYGIITDTYRGLPI
ncbi:MAG: hypothetical protein H6Q68_2196 [Firmicutes bacterium]|nr:hypothetical protein [Bacillota bacterium]